MASQIVILIGLTVTVTAGTLTPVIEERNSFHDVMAADLSSTFFSDFEENIRYIHSNGKTEVYDGIVDIPSADASIISESSIVAYKPSVQLRRIALKCNPTKGDKLTVRGSRYRVDNYSDDGVGVITVFLARV